MKKSLLCLTFPLTLLVACTHPQQESATIGTMKNDHIVQVFTKYQKQHPDAQLRDVYKYCFQDKFGPAHIIADSLSCAHYIDEEVKRWDTVDWGGQQFYEPLELYGNYVRVNIRAVKQGKITTGQLTSALLRSGTPPDSASIAEWAQEWNRIVTNLSNMAITISNFKQDSIYIAELLNKGEYVVHHSKQFNRVNHYNYRLIRRDIFEKELLPYLKEENNH